MTFPKLRRSADNHSFIFFLMEKKCVFFHILIDMKSYFYVNVVSYYLTFNVIKQIIASITPMIIIRFTILLS